MDKAKGHHHHGGHHPHGTVPDHHDQTPGQCEESDGSAGDNTSCVDGGRYGTISLQANNSLDIFQMLEVRKDDEEVSDEAALIKVKDLQFDSDKPWVTGNVPELIPVNVEGDTIQVHALFKGECFDKEYKLRIYVEYEEAETIVLENSEEQNRDRNCDLEPQEIHL